MSQLAGGNLVSYCNIEYAAPFWGGVKNILSRAFIGFKLGQ